MGLAVKLSSSGLWVMVPLLQFYLSCNSYNMIVLLIMHSTTLCCIYYCLKLLAAMLLYDNNGVKPKKICVPSGEDDK